MYCLQVRLLSIIVLLLFQFVCTRYGVEIDIKKTSNGIVLLTLHLAFSNGKNSSDYHIAKQISTLIEYGMIHIYICVTTDMNKVYRSYTLCMKQNLKFCTFKTVVDSYNYTSKVFFQSEYYLVIQ